uniref:CMP/dCMP-type deaminase domain-containing protein n=1 Tax=viral metagenome TaxID=1070528 RepID=A0A6C0HZS0_9ZZZZ
MENILNQMFLKRYCLPINTDIRSYELGEKNLRKTSVCGNYNHISCVLKGNKSVLTFGINKIGDSVRNTPGIHAETDAILKLLPLRNKKKLENINILVIRISPTNKIQSSKPCNHCIKMLNILPKKRGYHIQDIYYSNTYGEIIKTTLGKLENEEKHISQYYRNRNKKNNRKL